MISRLNHAVLYVRNARASAAFYREVLGFVVVEEDPAGRAVFLRASGSDNHHDLGLFSVGPAAAAPRGAPGLYHLAWQVDTVDELADLAERLRHRGALVGASDHGASKSLYAVDPDGIELELMWQVPRSEWGEYAERAIVAPLDLAAELRRWSGVVTR